MKKRTLVSRVYKERGAMNECSPGINVIQAFQCQLAKLGSQSPVSEASDQQQDHYGRYGGRVHRGEGFVNCTLSSNPSLLLQVIDKRVGRNGKTEYLLKWRGFGDEVKTFWGF